jgi:murein DD-endopeptidase MepM/ murein hydrolase activator NlpD
MLLSALALAFVTTPASAQPTDGPVPAPSPVFAPVVGPVGYGELDARYGTFRHGHVHAGQDVFAAAGTPVVAVRAGVVVGRGTGDGRGNRVAVYSPGSGETYVYFHLQWPSPAEVGDSVEAGQRIGRLGCTGSCFGDHLHFEIRAGRGEYGRPRDPLPVLRAWPQAR